MLDIAGQFVSVPYFALQPSHLALAGLAVLSLDRAGDADRSSHL